MPYRTYMRTLDNLLLRAGFSPHLLIKRGGFTKHKRRFGSHSARRGGAQALARAGVRIDLIKLWGRWKSNAVDRYLEEAALEGRGGSMHAELLNCWG